VRRLDVETTLEMLEGCRAQIEGVDALIMAAAPADHRPRERAAQKLKKSLGEGTSLALEENPDILKSLDARRRGVFVVGFAAESEELAAHAAHKLADKDLDLIVANDITERGAGFGGSTNAALLLGRDGTSEPIALTSKDAMADLILDRVAAALGG